MALATGDAELTTIDEALDAFPRRTGEAAGGPTFRSYLEVIELFRLCMNDYGPSSTTGEEKRRWEAAYKADDDAAFTGLSGPAKTPGEI